MGRGLGTERAREDSNVRKNGMWLVDDRLRRHREGFVMRGALGCVVRVAMRLGAGALVRD